MARSCDTTEPPHRSVSALERADRVRGRGYLPLLEMDSPVNDVETPQVWSGQLVLTTTEDETLVLDCLVPTSDACPEEDRTLLVPITLCAHLPHRHTSLSVSDIDGIVGEWVKTGAPVDISLGQDRGIAILQIGGLHGGDAP